MFIFTFSYFNSIKVQLEPAAGGAIGYTHFNSIKVQLEPYYSAQQYLC